MKRPTKPPKPTLGLTAAHTLMKGGALLSLTYDSKGRGKRKQLWDVGGHPLQPAIAKRLSQRVDVEPGADSLFPGITQSQTWRFKKTSAWRADRHAKSNPLGQEGNMPRVEDVFKKEWLKAAELEGDTPVIIRSPLIAKDGYNGVEEQIIEVELDGRLRLMKVTTTCGYDIKAALGDSESLNWPGKTITVYPYELLIKSEDKTVLTIRTRTESAAVSEAAPSSNGAGPSKPRPKPDDMNDDAIPF